MASWALALRWMRSAEKKTVQLITQENSENISIYSEWQVISPKFPLFSLHLQEMKENWKKSQASKCFRTSNKQKI